MILLLISLLNLTIGIWRARTYQPTAADLLWAQGWSVVLCLYIWLKGWN